MDDLCVSLIVNRRLARGTCYLLTSGLTLKGSDPFFVFRWWLWLASK